MAIITLETSRKEHISVIKTLAEAWNISFKMTATKPPQKANVKGKEISPAFKKEIDERLADVRAGNFKKFSSYTAFKKAMDKL